MVYANPDPGGRQKGSKENTRDFRPLILPYLPTSSGTYRGDVSHISFASIFTTTAVAHVTISSHLNGCRSPAWSTYHLFCPLLHPFLRALFL